eukprot:g16782.t1
MRGRPPEDWEGTELPSLLFTQCPPSFQLQVRGFYERVGLALLGQAPHVSAKLLEDVAPAFARAGLLHVVPFDLLRSDTRDLMEAAGGVPPREPSLAEGPSQWLGDLRVPRVPSSEELSKDVQMPLMSFLLEELEQGDGSSSSSRDGVRPARLLASYARLLPDEGDSELATRPLPTDRAANTLQQTAAKQ